MRIPSNAGWCMSLTATQSNRKDLLSDRTLLRRFVLDGDESAFAEIVQRHSGLVMSVCYRLTGQQSDADDAFQATFLVLAQKPAGIDNVLSLAGWLYSVAWRTSVRVVRLRRRRMMEALPEEPASQDTDPLRRISEASDLAALDEELNELPQKYRDVLVMNYLAQQTSQQIADQLNESKGAVDGRLREAKRLLRVRLARRGVEVGALMVAATLAQSAVAAPALIAKTQTLAGIVAGTTGVTSAYTTQELLKLKTLTSAGATIMMTKIALAVTVGCAMLIGGFGMSRLNAFQSGGGQEPTVALDAQADVPEEAKSAEEAVVQAVQEAAIPGSGSISGGGIGSGLSADGEGGGGVAPAAGGIIGDGLVGGMPMGSGMGMAGPGLGAGMGPIPAKSNLSFSRLMDRSAEAQMIQRLGTEQSPEMIFAGEQPLARILDTLSEHLGTRIIVDRKDMSGELTATTLNEIMVQDVQIPAGTMSVAAVLDEVLSNPESTELTWIVRNGLVVITTEEAAEEPENLILHSYDITVLRDLQWTTPLTPNIPPGKGGMAGGAGYGSVADPQMGMGGYGSGYTPATSLNPQETPADGSMQAAPRGMGSGGGGLGGGGYGPPQPKTWEANVVQAIVELTSPPCRWVQTGDEIGTMVVVGNRLVVRQTRKGQQLVSEAIEQLEEAAKSRAQQPGGMIPGGIAPVLN
ncbi:MAG: sigma-70 family RNA polymerase sigma factor [Planctomycetaceae bacterium]